MLSYATQHLAASAGVSWYSSQSLAASWSYSPSAALLRSDRRAISRLASSRFSAAVRAAAWAFVSAACRSIRRSAAARMAASFSRTAARLRSVSSFTSWMARAISASFACRARMLSCKLS